MRCLLSGGAGYIGSHLAVDLFRAGHEVIVVDDFSTGHVEALRRVQALTGRRVRLVRGSIGDVPLVTRALDGVDVVFHLAASKAVAESVLKPERYFLNNLAGLAGLLQAMRNADVRRIVYSSTAAVYGTHQSMPLREDAPVCPESPYGLSKAQGEQMLEWMARSHPWSVVALRFFNPVGAHPSGQIGEHSDQPSNLVPRVLSALTGNRTSITVYGTDYDTPDGTCLRDFIHVCDLARAHLAAMSALEAPGYRVFNVGTGRAYSVREVIGACERVCGLPVPAVDGPRREGDIAVAVADPRKFAQECGFRARYTLDDMVASAWRWATFNPRGYAPAVEARRDDLSDRVTLLPFG